MPIVINFFFLICNNIKINLIKLKLFLKTCNFREIVSISKKIKLIKKIEFELTTFDQKKNVHYLYN